MRWHYQWLIIHDFLPRFVDQNVLNSLVSAFRAHKLPKPFVPKSPMIPVEFAVAGYTFGHAKIQNKYRMTPGGAVLDLFGGNAIPTFGPKPIAQNLGTTCSARPEGESGGPRQTALLQTMKGARRLCRGALSMTQGLLCQPRADNQA